MSADDRLTIHSPDLRVDADVEWSRHGITRLQERIDGEPVPSDVYDESVEVDYPDAWGGSRGRYHEATDSVLIVRRERRRSASRGWHMVDVVVTVIELTDRPEDEQRCVREQVRE